jgi:lipopolysaccharide assembly outer membrane protein LptD (OstA)
MTRLPLILLLLLLALPGLRGAEEESHWKLEALNDQGWAAYSFDTGDAIGTNGVKFTYGGAVLIADSMQISGKTGEVFADGGVKIQRQEQLWVGEHVIYNYNTREIQAREFRTGRTPFFISGEGLHAENTNVGRVAFTNSLLIATNAYLTTDDISDPAMRVKAKAITITPGRKLIARHALLYIGDVPVFYYPYYERNLGPRANNFQVLPGYRSSYGAYLLTSYHWFINDHLDAVLHADYREERGPGGGPDLNYYFGDWGRGSLNYYYIYDRDPNESGITNDLPHNRQRVNFSYLGTPATNLSIRSVVRYQSDFAMLHDFFENEYVQTPQPSTYFEVNKFWQNFSLDAVAQPRLNNFLETVERLPDVRLTGYRQQLWETPLYYESQSSAGYFRRLFAETNVLFSLQGPYGTNNYAAARADTYHQIVLPETFFGWLNLTPRVGGRFTYYSSASGPGAVTDEVYRGVFNTGAELSFKASRVWPGVTNSLLEVDGIRHIVEPSVNYAYVPKPNRTGTNEIPQFDFELPSLRLLPIEFPDYNSIDSIDSQDVVRLGVRNKLQTKRNGAVTDLIDWNVYTDWRLTPRPAEDGHIGQGKFSDVFSDLTFRPRSWLQLQSLTRFDVTNSLRMAFHELVIRPNDTWSWGISHFYLRDQFNGLPTDLGEGSSYLTSTLFYRLNENWGFRASHRYDVRAGRMDEQAYTVYRDFRAWTAALTFRVRRNLTGSDDYGVAFTFSVKAFPRFNLGADAVRPYSLLGG